MDRRPNRFNRHYRHDWRIHRSSRRTLALRAGARLLIIALVARQQNPPSIWRLSSLARPRVQGCYSPLTPGKILSFAKIRKTIKKAKATEKMTLAKAYARIRALYQL